MLRPQHRRCAALSVGGLQRHQRIRSKKTLHRDPRIGTVYLQKRKKRPLRATPKSLKLSRGAQPQTFETCPWHAFPRAERRVAPAQDRPVLQGPASLAGDDAHDEKTWEFEISWRGAGGGAASEAAGAYSGYILSPWSPRPSIGRAVFRSLPVCCCFGVVR